MSEAVTTGHVALTLRVAGPGPYRFQQLCQLLYDAYVLKYRIITSEGAIVASTVSYLLSVVTIELGMLVLDESIRA